MKWRERRDKPEMKRSPDSPENAGAAAEKKNSKGEIERGRREKERRGYVVRWRKKMKKKKKKNLRILDYHIRLYIKIV